MQPTGASRRSAQAVAVVLMLGVAAVALVVLASAGGSVRPVSESTISSSPRPIPTPSVTPKVSVPTMPTPPPMRERKPHQMPAWLAAILKTLLYVAGTLLVLFLLRLLYRMIRNVKLPIAETNDADDWERVKVDKLSDAVDAGLAAMESGTATDAVIACWVALEDAAASAGVARQPSETPSEFTVRVLAVGGISAPELTRLAGLYREARYSSHGSSEEARAEARAALTRLRDELTAAKAAKAAEAAARAQAASDAETVAAVRAGDKR
jgi:Domain of unknown function (DUF4129)